MKLTSALRARLPAPLKRMLRPLFDLSQRNVTKQDSELSFWESRFAADGGDFKNDWYQPIMLAMAQESSPAFLHGKIVADFGCGPRGSLAWALGAQMRIGIDVLASRYLERFGASLLHHNMVYLTSTERLIPLPTGFVDVMYTMNALDHVEDLEAACREILRVLRPGGELIGSFNLGEPPTRTEPQALDEARLRAVLLDQLDIVTYRIARQGPEGNLYRNFFLEDLGYRPGDPGFLWVRAQRRAG